MSKRILFTPMSYLTLGASALMSAATAFAQVAPAATSTTPSFISIDSSSPVCANGNSTQKACVTLATSGAIKKVDVFFLFDDTGSFAGFVPTVTGIFADVASGLQAALPDVEFGFGVGRFEDYGGGGNAFSGEDTEGRPFTLNQPILTSADAGGAASLATIINDALNRSAPGYGGDGPESSIAEGLYQVAAGDGFDGDGDGSTTGILGTQIAGTLDAQTSPDASGDVPAFSTLSPSVLKSGSVGGAGFRSDALKIVVVATDICSVAAFARDLGIPTSITGSNGVTEPISEFACSSMEAGSSRFGFVGTSKTVQESGDVSPLGAHTVPQTIAALNAAGIRVLGMVPSGGDGGDESESAIATAGGVGTPSGSGPSFSPNVFLSALARLTNGVDSDGNPLVFGIGSGSSVLKDNIISSVLAAAAKPLDISLNTDLASSALKVTPVPGVVPGVSPGGEACFDVTFAGNSLNFASGFNLNFFDVLSGLSVAKVPVSVECIAASAECSTVSVAGDQNALDGGATNLRNQVDRAANRLVQIAGRSARNTAKKLRADAAKAYTDAWTLLYTIPGAIQTCTDSPLCVKTSNQTLISTYASKSAKLKALVGSAVKELKKHGNSTKDSNKRLRDAATQHANNLAILGHIPVESSTCTSPLS